MKNIENKKKKMVLCIRVHLQLYKIRIHFGRISCELVSYFHVAHFIQFNIWCRSVLFAAFFAGRYTLVKIFAN